MINSVSNNGLAENQLSFISGIRSGMSNDGCNATMIMQYANNNKTDMDHDDEENSADSILNSHRRSRS